MSDLQLMLGKNDISVSDAMLKIDKNSLGILFLHDEYRKIVGTITDGDIRRFLLENGKLDDCAMEAANKNPKCARTIEEANHLYDKYDYVAVPIIEKDGTIIDFYAGDIKKKEKKYRKISLPVVINAGGKGTRLDPLTRVLPKPLIPVGDIPIMEQIIREYQLYDCNMFHVIVNYKRNLIKAYFADNESQYNITWYDEEKPLGTGGGLTFLKGKIKETFFFASCDALLTADYAEIVDFHRKNQNAITMICAYKSIQIPYGIVDIGENGTINKMQEKPRLSFLTNTGIYVVEPEIIDDLEDGVTIGFPDIIEIERKKGRKVAVYPISENDWMDMGQLPELEKMRRKLNQI